MVVQHNLSAMNANRMLGITQGTLSSSTEKLSSGYKVNRAADDAAGLSISEKMRKQIRGLTQASTNAEDGISAVQTAEGALTEVHDMLQRMNELATKAANGTYSESDRQTIQDEIDQLTTEIDRVSETTKFNEMYLLKGSAEGTSSETTVNAHDAGLDGTLTDLGNGKTTFQLTKALSDGDTVTIAGKEYTIGTDGKGVILDKSDLNTKTDGYAQKTDANYAFGSSALQITYGDSVTYQGTTYTLVNKISVDDINFASNDTFKIGDITYTISSIDSASATLTTNSSTGEVKGTIGKDKVVELIKEAVADGKQVTALSGMDAAVGGVNATTVNLYSGLQITDSLNKGEVSAFMAGDIKGDGTTKANLYELILTGEKLDGSGNTASTGATPPTDHKTKWEDLHFDVGDSVTLSGVTTVATDGTPKAARDVYNDIKDSTVVKVNDTITVGDGEYAIKYTVVEDADEDLDTYKVSRDTLLSMINDGDSVTYDDGKGSGVKKYTVIGDIASSSKATDVVSAKTAYSLMADELQKASSIGTDAGKEASVTSNGDGKFTIKQGSAEVKDALVFNLHVGADADMTNKIIVNLKSMSAAGLGIQGLNVKDTTGTAATYAIDAIEDAIKTVSAQRSLLGAVQNRLDHTINNLDNVVENTTSAESAIRDTDMATEMVKYSNANILSQAGQSMLAQANQSNQGVLSLLG